MSKLVDGILDLLFPPKCVFCRGILRRGESGVCARCRDSLPYRERPRTPGPDGVKAVCAPFRYAGDVSEALKRYKFKGMTAYASVFGRLVAQCVRDNLAGEYDIVSWVPLSSERLAERGYDQAMLIAMAAALELDDVAVETLRKTRNAAPQSLTGGAAGQHLRRVRGHRPRAGARQACAAHRRHHHLGSYGCGVRAYPAQGRSGGRGMRLCGGLG